MGAAAQHRGDAVIARAARAAIDAQRMRDDLARCVQVAEDCNAFTRDALALLVEPGGLRRATVERSRSRRGWAPRHAALASAHCAWVDADPRDAAAYRVACIARARAAHALLVFALGDWTMPGRIAVPRVVTCAM